jgi:tetratricopeptide (TPR) repeat protein
MRCAFLIVCVVLIWPPSSAGAQITRAGSARQSEAEHHRDEAMQRLTEGDLQAALTHIRTALELDPRDPASHDSLGVILGEAGQFEAAIVEFREAARLDPRAAEVHFHLGLALERIGKPREAIAEYERALGLEPELLEARYGLSSVCAKVGDINGAIALLRAVVEAVPQLAEARYNLGLNLWNRYKQASGFRQKHDVEEAVEALTAAAALESREPKFHAALGQLLAETQELSPAIEHLRSAVTLAPNDPEHAYNFGLALRLKGDLDRAQVQFRSAVRLNPRHALAYRALGLVLRQKGDFEPAADALRRSLAERPDDAKGHHVLGTILLKLNRLDEAVAELRGAIRLDPDLTEARVTLAQTLAKAGMRQEARLQQAEIQRINAEQAARGRTLVLLQAGVERLTNGDVASALQQLREAAALSPRFPETHYQLGLAIERSSAVGEAEPAFRHVLALAPDHAGAHYRLGLLLRRRDVSEAAAELRKAVEIEPGLIGARRALAQLALDAGDRATALTELQTLVIWAPQAADAHSDLAAALKAQGDAEGAARELAIAQRLKQAARPPR